jgi:hypothetical protein
LGAFAETCGQWCDADVKGFVAKSEYCSFPAAVVVFDPRGRQTNSGLILRVPRSAKVLRVAGRGEAQSRKAVVVAQSVIAVAGAVSIANTDRRQIVELPSNAATGRGLTHLMVHLMSELPTSEIVRR